MTRDRADVMFLSLVMVVMASFGFGAWVSSFGAGVWMFVVLVWAEGLSENLRAK